MIHFLIGIADDHNNMVVIQYIDYQQTQSTNHCLYTIEYKLPGGTWLTLLFSQL